MTAHPIDTEALRKQYAHLVEKYGPEAWAESRAHVVLSLLEALATAEHRADEAEGVHRDLTSSLGFGDGITEPMADNKTIIQHVGEAVTDAQELWELTQAACVEAGCDPEEDCYDHHPVRRAERAERRATRAEAQSVIRGRAVAVYQQRAREAEARIKAVEDVHQHGGSMFVDGMEDHTQVCASCLEEWPCPTIRTLTDP